MNAPVNTTVLSIEVPGAGNRPDVTAAFEKIITVAAMQLGAVTKEQGGPQLTLTLAPDVSAGAALQRMVNAFADFESVISLKVRGVVHYGTVFRSETAGKVSYLGSAIRSSQSALRRTDIKEGVIATREFVTYANAFNPPLVPSTAIPNSPDGLSMVRLAGNTSSAAKGGTGLSSADPEFLAFLKKRLASDLGPFAAAMVESARRNSATAPSLVAALAREVDNADARAKFEADLLGYLKTR